MAIKNNTKNHHFSNLDNYTNFQKGVSYVALYWDRSISNYRDYYSRESNIRSRGNLQSGALSYI